MASAPLRRRAAIVVGAAAIAVIAYFVLRPTDESRIRAQLDRLAHAVRISEADAQTSSVARFAHVNEAFRDIFEPEVHVTIPEVPSLQSGREDLAEVVTGAPRYFRSLDVDFTDVTITLDPAHTLARAQTTARIRAVGREGEASKESRAVDLRFVKKEGAWRVETLTVWSTQDATP